MIFKPFSLPFLHYTYYCVPLTILEHLFGHCGTLQRLRGPSWTFMDSKMDHKMDPARLISGVLIDLKTMDKLEFTAWIGVNPTFGSRGISVWKLVGHICPPPRLIRVKAVVSIIFFNYKIEIINFFGWCGVEGLVSLVFLDVKLVVMEIVEWWCEHFLPSGEDENNHTILPLCHS